MSRRIPAVYMRGGTSKGVFFRRDDLPLDPLQRGRLLMRILGSPDPYGKQTDGMGGATSSTSKVVLLNASERQGYDVDFLFGQVAIDKPVIDWSGNCGNLSAAVGPFAIMQGLVTPPSGDGHACVRIWQVNTRSRIEAHVPVAAGEVVEHGSFAMDGVAGPGAEIVLDFHGPDNSDTVPSNVFPTGAARSQLVVPGVGTFDATLIHAGNPTIFVRAAQLGLRGNEMQADVNGDAALLARCETIRAHAAVVMGLAKTVEDAIHLQPHTPKLAFAAEPVPYLASNGRLVSEAEIDLNVRIFSMGKLHHAMTGTGAIAIAVAAAIPGTIVSEILAWAHDPSPRQVRFGHPSGVTGIAAEVAQRQGVWSMVKVSVSRSARRLMEGWVVVPDQDAD